jgi:hypothetical protein
MPVLCRRRAHAVGTACGRAEGGVRGREGLNQESWRARLASGPFESEHPHHPVQDRRQHSTIMPKTPKNPNRVLDPDTL